MTLTEAVSRIAALTNKLATDSIKVIPRMKAHINEVCRREWNTFPWTFRKREYMIPTVAGVTSGTVSVTNANNLITFSSAVLSTSEHQGWYFRITTDNPVNWYKVTHVASTTTAYISPAYQGTTDADAVYELRKVDYDIPSEVDQVLTLKMLADGHYITIQDPMSLNESAIVTETGMPAAAVVWESNPIPSTYTTGTVSGTIATNTLTGSGTAWLSNLKPGDIINVSSTDYTVYEVLTDTSLTLYNALKATVSAGTTYTATRKFVAKVRVKPTSDQIYTISIIALRKYHNLVADSDSNELLNRYESAVIQSCVELEHIAGPDSRAAEQNSRASALWAEAKSQDRGQGKRQRKPIFSNRRYDR